MADTKTSDLTALIGSGTAAGDKFVILDVSDTTQGAGGTLKSLTRSAMVTALDAAGMTVNADIGVTVQAYAAVLDATTASFTTADETKLDGIEALADVTDTANVTAAGALMDSEVTSLSGIKTLTVPDNTTVTTFATTLLDDTTQGAMQTTLGLVPGTDVQAYDADTLKADVADVLTAGFAATPYNAGTKSSGTYTPDEANGNYQYAINGGAHTLAPPANSCSLVIQYTNDGSAGTITTSGFTKVSGSFTTTDAEDFMCYITKIGTFSHLNIVSLQ